MKSTRRVAALAATSLACGALLVLPTASASAASGCTDAGFAEPGPSGVYTEAFNCSNAAWTPVYSGIGSGNVVGYLTTSYNWFVCTDDDTGVYVGGPHPYRWEWTEADNGNWGWVPDTAIASETDPLIPCGGPN